MENLIRTDLYCTECGKTFIAELDLDIDGDHSIECPHCGHEHCRVVEDGRVTEARWSSTNSRDRIKVSKRRIWKHNVLKMQTSTACGFMREKWINLGIK
jgi:DNA-directed RNA polymerase subunit RPC12/RpoP